MWAGGKVTTYKWLHEETVLFDELELPEESFKTISYHWCPESFFFYAALDNTVENRVSLSQLSTLFV